MVSLLTNCMGFCTGIKSKSAASGWLVADLLWWFGGKTGSFRTGIMNNQVQSYVYK